MFDSMLGSDLKLSNAEEFELIDSVQHGLDGVILYSETAHGQNPVEAVQIIANSCAEAERDLGYSIEVDTSEVNVIDNYFDNGLSQERK